MTICLIKMQGDKERTKVKKGRLKVTLIVTCYNSKQNLIGTLDSILKQSYNPLEIVIVDGASTDGTIDIIKKYAASNKERFDIRWISESDHGIYDAMNKGYRMSTGDVIAFFNDKFLMNNAIEMMVDVIERTQSDGAHADLIYATDTKVKRYWKMGTGRISQGWMPGHPTLYLKREVYETYGLYRPEYSCSADFEFMVRILKDDKVKLAYVPETIISMYYGGTSTADANSYWISIKESHKALVDNGVKCGWFIILLRTVRTLIQFASARFYQRKNERLQNRESDDNNAQNCN